MGLQALNAAVHARNWELVDKLLDQGAPINLPLDGVRPTNECFASTWPTPSPDLDSLLRMEHFCLPSYIALPPLAPRRPTRVTLS